MKKSDLRELNITELNEKLRECMESLQNYRFQLAMQQLEDFTVISKVRKEIAQIKTALKEYEIGIRKIEGA
jgi:large subunit ribosomal protein L29